MNNLYIIRDNSFVDYISNNNSGDWDSDKKIEDHDPAQNALAYEMGKIVNGYGISSGISIVVTEGVTAKVDIDFMLETIDEQEYANWLSFVKSSLKDRERILFEEIEKQEKSLQLASMWGILFANGKINEYQNKASIFSTLGKNELTEISKKFYELNKTSIHVTGSISATGITHRPIKASMFLRETEVEFYDNKSFKVVDTISPLLATDDMRILPSNNIISNLVIRPAG